MHRVLLGLLCLLLPVGVAAQPIDTISLSPGETIVLTLSEGRLVVGDRQHAGPLSAYEAGVVQKLQGIELPKDAGVQPAVPIMKGELPGTPDPLTPNAVRITFREVQGDKRGPAGGLHAVLTIHNGFAQSVRYRAAMLKGGEVSPTDVCEVIPEIRGVEHWPYRIERLDLSQLRLEPYGGGDPVCE
jgi:hypothetical protein